MLPSVYINSVLCNLNIREFIRYRGNNTNGTNTNNQNNGINGGGRRGSEPGGVEFGEGLSLSTFSTFGYRGKRLFRSGRGGGSKTRTGTGTGTKTGTKTGTTSNDVGGMETNTTVATSNSEQLLSAPIYSIERGLEVSSSSISIFDRYGKYFLMRRKVKREDVDMERSLMDGSLYSYGIKQDEVEEV